MFKKTPILIPIDLLPDGTPYTNTPSDFAAKYHKGTEKTPRSEVYVWCHALYPISNPTNRIERAAKIANRRQVTIVKATPATAEVILEVSSSDPTKAPYTVTISATGKNLACSCPDEPPHGKYCKHIYAAAMALVYEEYWSVSWDDMPLAKMKANLIIILLTTPIKPKFDKAVQHLHKRFGGQPVI